MNLFVQAAQAQGMETDVAEGVCAIARKAISQGLAEVDYSAIYNAINLEN